MKSKSLDYDGQKKLFSRYSIETLSSLETLYDLVLEEKRPISLNFVAQKKYDESLEDNNGREEITDSMRIDWFDISEIINTIDDLNDKELAYISKPICNAISLFPEDSKLKIFKQLLEFQSVQEQTITDRITPISNGMFAKDVKKFFDKFCLVSLTNFDIILDYCHHEKINDIKRLKNEVLLLKQRKHATINKESVATYKEFDITNFQSDFSSLDNRELDFFHELVENAALYLESIQEFEDEYKAINEEFNSKDFPYQQISNLLDLIEKEKIDRPKRMVK